MFANLIALVHGIWVLTVVSGPLISWRWPRFRWVHLGMMVITILIIISGNLCPLTTLENQLRAAAHPASTYSGSFIATYLDKIFGLPIHPAWIFYSLVGWFIIWGPLYFIVWPRTKNRHWRNHCR